MNMFALLQRIWLELQGYTEAEDKGAYIAERITDYFDWLATKAPIPAWSLGLILWLVDKLYTAYTDAETTQGPDVAAGRESFLAGLPAPPFVEKPTPIVLATPSQDQTPETPEKGFPPCDGCD